MSIEVELKRAVKTGKIEVGTKGAERSILFGKSKGIIMSSAAREGDKIRLKYFCDLEKIPFKLVEHVPLEFGKIIGLSYSVSTVSIIDEGKSKILQELKK